MFKNSLLIAVALLFVSACVGSPAPATSTVAPPTITLTPTEQVTVAPTPTAQATATPTSPPPTSAPVVDTPTPQIVDSIFYYAFVGIGGKTPPAGSVVILPDILILGPTPANLAPSPDIAADLKAALVAMHTDANNVWTSDDFQVVNVTFANGHATVDLQGELLAVGGIELVAARMQILLTVFANPAVQSATVSLNDDNIANLGISHSSEAKPADYVYPRAEIEAFIAENAYAAP